MKRLTQLKLAEVKASYRPARLAAHRCGLVSCQEDGECAFPTRCVALSSDLSPDDRRAGPADCVAIHLEEGEMHCERCAANWDAAFEGPPCRPPVNTDDMLDPMDPGEYAWRAEGRDSGWKPPERRPWWQRLWVIRHVSALWLSWKVHTYAGAWANVGIGVGGPNPQDLWVVEGAYHGYW